MLSGRSVLGGWQGLHNPWSDGLQPADASILSAAARVILSPAGILSAAARVILSAAGILSPAARVILSCGPRVAATG